MRPGGITGTRKYADWAYLGGLLKVKNGGTKPQELKWQEVADTVAVGQTQEIWAYAYESLASPKSRKVGYLVEAGDAARIVKDTLYVDKLGYRPGDTAWAAQIRFNHSGVVKVTAYQWGDDPLANGNSNMDGFMPKYIDTLVYVRKAQQTIRGFIDDIVVPIDDAVIIFDAYADRAGVRAEVSYESSDNSIALVSSGVLVLLEQGVVEVCAYNNGDSDWDSVRLCKKVTIYSSKIDSSDYAIVDDSESVKVGDLEDVKGLDNLDNLDGLDLDKILPAWDGGVLDSVGPGHYSLRLACRWAEVKIPYNKTSVISIELVKYWGTVEVEKTNPPLVEDGELSVIVDTMPSYDRVDVLFRLLGGGSITTRIDIERALPADYIYYDGVKFPHRLEVVNNALAPGHAGKCNYKTGCLLLYRWYRDGVLVDATTANANGGVFYRGDRQEIAGHSFSVKALYVNGSYTWICGKRIPASTAAANDGLAVYPNPVSGRLTVVHSKLKNVKQGIILIYAAGSGALAASYPISSADVHDGSVEVDLSRLPEGAYVVRFDGEAAIVVKKK
jgi:hypothetical protein